MEKFLKNQKHLSIAIFGFLLFSSLSWYFFIYQGLTKEHRNSRQLQNRLSSNVSKYKNLESQITTMQREWETLNTEFKTIVDKIPDKRLFENVTDYLYSLIINHGLKIQNFAPSNSVIDKKTILLAETGEEVLIEKIPIDITLKGSFINFGQLLESMLASQYRLTASNIEIIQKDLATVQTIKFISYTYFQTVKNKIRLNTMPSMATKNSESKKPKPNKKITTNKAIEVSEVLDTTVKVNSENLQGVPEMWLEPATEPVDESIPLEESIAMKSPVIEKKVTPSKTNKNNSKVNQEKNPKPKINNKYQDFHSIVVLETTMCQKVKNNQPLMPGSQFSTEIGKVYCHSLLNNNSGKHNDIYHIWYLNGNLKAKVRIRVRNGKEIPAISHREFGKNDIGRWKIEITDSDKKILDTIIFELV